MDSDLIDRAVKAGLKIAPCPVCRDGSSGYCECARCMPDASAMCVACGGDGEDRTPWGIFGAVALAWAGKSGVKVHGDRVELFDWPSAGRWAPHDGTPAGIATAAVTAFCRAMEAT